LPAKAVHLADRIAAIASKPAPTRSYSNPLPDQRQLLTPFASATIANNSR